MITFEKIAVLTEQCQDLAEDMMIAVQTTNGGRLDTLIGVSRALIHPLLIDAPSYTSQEAKIIANLNITGFVDYILEESSSYQYFVKMAFEAGFSATSVPTPQQFTETLDEAPGF